MKTIDSTYRKKSSFLKSTIDDIMNLSPAEIDFVAEEERSFPGNQEFVDSGYCEKMLKRYIFAGERFCRGKSILDSCCGIGWGTYLISRFAKSVTAFDFEPKAVTYAKAKWQTSNINWMVGNALDFYFLENKKFDTVLAMETIEHFSKKDACRYLANLANALNPDGILIGTSYFPEKTKRAQIICSKNPYHLHIFTVREINNLLKDHFLEHVLIDQWMFIAKI